MSFLDFRLSLEDVSKTCFDSVFKVFGVAAFYFVFLHALYVRRFLIITCRLQASHRYIFKKKPSLIMSSSEIVRVASYAPSAREVILVAGFPGSGLVGSIAVNYLTE